MWKYEVHPNIVSVPNPNILKNQPWWVFLVPQTTVQIGRQIRVDKTVIFVFKLKLAREEKS